MRQDILLDDENELIIRNGDFTVGEADRQHVEHIIITHPGEYKNTPLLGFAAVTKLKSTINDMQFKRDLKIQLNYDGYQNPRIDTSSGFEALKIEI